MCLTPKLISECRPNSNFSANHDNENDKNKNLGNNPANKYIFKVYGFPWTYFTPCSSVFNIDFEHVIVH